MLISLIIGGGLGFLISILGRKIGLGCTLLCNPYIAVLFGAAMGYAISTSR